MLTIACVWRTGGDYTVDDVNSLMAGVRQNIQMEFRTVCLTDEPKSAHPAVDVVFPLIHDWPGWWAKMELFYLAGPVLYFDLDTIIRKDITKLSIATMNLTDQVIMLSDFYHGSETSGIMGWKRDMRWMASQFTSYAKKHGFTRSTDGSFMRCGAYRGDQDFIREQLRSLGVPVFLAQHLQPGIKSYKVDIEPLGKVTEDTTIICFHGRPRPWEVTLPEVQG